jgi:hypothetical protein
VKWGLWAVLDALEFDYGRPFADLWAFVAFAETEPPKSTCSPHPGGRR